MHGCYVNAFVEWNSVLLRAFFSPAHEHEDVVFAIGRDELNDIAPELGGYDGLLDTVRSGPPWLPHQDGELGQLGAWASSLIDQRGSPPSRPVDYVDPHDLLPFGAAADRMPTYLPLLAALVAIYADPAPGGFYPTAQSALGLPPTWSSSQLHEVNGLWDDLAQWTVDTGGRFGRFRPRVLGGHTHVGRLAAQCVFRSGDAERRCRTAGWNVRQAAIDSRSAARNESEACTVARATGRCDHARRRSTSFSQSSIP
jgi:hypothetical protein